MRKRVGIYVLCLVYGIKAMSFDDADIRQAMQASQIDHLLELLQTIDQEKPAEYSRNFGNWADESGYPDQGGGGGGAAKESDEEIAARLGFDADSLSEMGLDSQQIREQMRDFLKTQKRESEKTSLKQIRIKREMLKEIQRTQTYEDLDIVAKKFFQQFGNVQWVRDVLHEGSIRMNRTHERQRNLQKERQREKEAYARDQKDYENAKKTFEESYSGDAYWQEAFIDKYPQFVEFIENDREFREKIKVEHAAQERRLKTRNEWNKTTPEEKDQWLKTFHKKEREGVQARQAEQQRQREEHERSQRERQAQQAEQRRYAEERAAQERESRERAEAKRQQEERQQRERQARQAEQRRYAEERAAQERESRERAEAKRQQEERQQRARQGGGGGGAAAAQSKTQDQIQREADFKAIANKSMTRRRALEILSLPRNAAEAEVRGAYLKLTRMYHPDKTKNLPEKERKDKEEHFKLLTAVNELFEQKMTPREGFYYWNN